MHPASGTCFEESPALHDPTGCRPRELASGRTCRVVLCEHGTVHLHLGALTIRLSPGQLHHTVATLEAAARALDGPAPNAPAPRLLC